MQTIQWTPGKVVTWRKLCFALAIIVGMQGCAHKSPPPANLAAPQAATAGQQPLEKKAEPSPAPPPVIEQHALDRLKAMSEKLAAAKSFAYHSLSTVEVPAKTGQFLTLYANAEVTLERPNKLRANITGDVPNIQFFFNGSTITVFDPQKNLFAVTDAPKSIDEMLPFVAEKFGIDFPADDFLFSDPYARISKNLTHAIEVGQTKVNGIPAEHFAYMNADANVEIWIDTGPSALPRRVAVTYKTLANFPRFLLEFLDWNLNAKPGDSQFTFKKPAGAKRIEFDPGNGVMK
jgi:hypothetical protein